MDIKEIKKKKSEAESSILEILKQFEKDTGIYISYASASVDRYGGDMPVCGANEKPRKAKPKGLYDFNISIQFDKEEY